METADFDLRYTEPEDAESLRKWLNCPDMLHWFPMSEGKELDDAILCWIGFARFKCSLTATYKGTPCGIGTLFLMPYRKVAHHCMFKIIVDPQHQGKGVGGSLIKNLKHLAKNYFNLELIHIEVFEGNPIVSLLHKLEFREYARQEKFVKEGDVYRARILLESYL